MHAAASYAHLELLEYLLSIGGDINLRDDDGDSPLYVVESVETARWMVGHGADPSLTNDEGLTVRSIPTYQSALDVQIHSYPESSWEGDGAYWNRQQTH